MKLEKTIRQKALFRQILVIPNKGNLKNKNFKRFLTIMSAFAHKLTGEYQHIYP